MERDQEERIVVVEELCRLAGIYNSCIVYVLDFIPNEMTLRGHLGSELQRKAVTILSIEPDDSLGASGIKTLKVREYAVFFRLFLKISRYVAMILVSLRTRIVAKKG